jgi:hypothetical protein
MLLSVYQISELTARDRHGSPKRLENLPFLRPPIKARSVRSREALPLIHAVDNLEAARAAQSSEPGVTQRGERGRSAEAAHRDSNHARRA